MRPLSKSLLLATALAFAAPGVALACSDVDASYQGYHQHTEGYHKHTQMLMDQYPEGAPVSELQAYGQQIFVRYDTDGDGYLSDEEPVLRNKAAVEAEGNVVIFDNHAIKPVDADGDGRISHDEWNAEVGAYFGSLDLNNNGIVDSAEAGAVYPTQ